MSLNTYSNPTLSGPASQRGAPVPRERFLRMAEVQHCVGLSKTQIYRLIAAGQFPKSIFLSQASVGWLESDISAWIAAKLKAARAG